MSSAFYNTVAKSTAHRQSREDHARLVRLDLQLLPELFSIAYRISDKNHHKACWILELIIEEDINLLTMHLDNFCIYLPQWHADGAVRSAAKISMMAAQEHTRKAKNKDHFLSEKHIKIMSETCFDWLIGHAKVATKAYAMRALFELGKSEAWIYGDLKTILSDDFHKHSPAYQGAARDILKKIGKD
ncbi:hypothetical protein [Flavobacterium pallidum]|uniref:Adenylosuccinate lyase n=1 Tax=Flavobacterium pallidum TaxID=2172098 RepID=A0A2S1SH03_9FLAO|nr:hypothetical protein [Flavobacterium pallidum]AWI25627.1 hypothetical protein HYN49_06800 [Flavobacterium pallidum]